MPIKLEQSPDADGRVALDQQRLKALRKALGLSQEALADLCLDQRLCVSLASIKRAEAGKSVLYRTARHIARFFQIEVIGLARPIANEHNHARRYLDRGTVWTAASMQFGSWG